MFTRPKHYGLLLGALLSLLLATSLSFIRWFVLVRALAIPFTLRDAFRLGFLGYLFNFVGPGAVGGDLFKAYFLARDQKERRAEAVATIFLDRVIGMYALMLVATTAILVCGASNLPDLGMFMFAVPWLTLCVTLGFVVLLLPQRFSDWFVEPMTNLPGIGGIVHRVVDALERYRQHRGWFVSTIVIGLAVHTLLAFCIHLADRAIHPATPTLSEHLIISPIAGAVSALPIPGGGLGTYEAGMSFLFQHVPSQPVEDGQGFAVALIYRLLTILIAAVGLVYYVLNRRAVANIVSVMETEHDADTGRQEDGAVGFTPETTRT